MSSLPVPDGSVSSNVNDAGSSPTPDQIIALAVTMGYTQRRPSVSATLFFIEREPAHGMPACRINVFYTTRSIMTHLNHPGPSGSNELWRSNAYNDLEELQTIFANPRIHTGKGYRNAEHAVRGCVGCGEMKRRSDFSMNQWSKGPDLNKCKDCTAAASVSHLTSGLENTTLKDPSFPALTQGLLKTHDKKHTNKNVEHKLERRQFNCPDCPKYGRGEYVFFKKVPEMKPIVKCPKCKKASNGKCKRLYPIPKGSEKGYGLYKCSRCGDKWGSSRAVSNIGQECFSCVGKGVSGELVTPFRLEVHKKKKAGGGRGMKRVPREPIGEDEADEREYGDADRQRNDFSGGSAFGGGGESERSYGFEPRNDADELSGGGESEKPYGFEFKSEADESSVGSKVTVGTNRIPKGFKHKCAGCASGACKNRKVPKSEVHDLTDGNTVSTRASVVTNSSIDKSDFFDRDENFTGFEDNDWEDV